MQQEECRAPRGTPVSRDRQAEALPSRRCAWEATSGSRPELGRAGCRASTDLVEGLPVRVFLSRTHLPCVHKWKGDKSHAHVLGQHEPPGRGGVKQARATVRSLSNPRACGLKELQGQFGGRVLSAACSSHSSSGLLHSLEQTSVQMSYPVEYTSMATMMGDQWEGGGAGSQDKAFLLATQPLSTPQPPRRNTLAGLPLQLPQEEGRGGHCYPGIVLRISETLMKR